MPSVELLRMFDAAANRAAEGLRVVEDYLRFGLDDAHLTRLAKALRHDLTAALQTVPSHARHHARDTQRDVGTAVATAAEQSRIDLADIVAANFNRAEQALRTLEETAKTFDAALAGVFEQLRYRVYTLEKATDITRGSLARLADARLYVLLDGGESVEQLTALARPLISAGVHVLQLRDKRLTDRQLLERGRCLRTLTQGTATLMIVNDRPDLAVLCHADGVHVGQDELTVKDARAIVGPRALVGVSTHSIQQARQAVLDGADYLGVGPTFPSETKEFASFPGILLLREVQAEIRLPAFAIGGITAANIQQVRDAGFTRVAVSRAIHDACAPQQAALEFLQALT